eukprot:g9166.t1
MDVDGVDSDAAGADAGAAGEREGEPSCYACRGGLGTEGGDVLCSFCDRAACQALVLQGTVHTRLQKKPLAEQTETYLGELGQELLISFSPCLRSFLVRVEQ